MTAVFRLSARSLKSARASSLSSLCASRLQSRPTPSPCLSAISPSHRNYATKPQKPSPKPWKPKKDDKSKEGEEKSDDTATTPDAPNAQKASTGKAPPGFEHLYESKGLSTPPSSGNAAPGERPPLPEGFVYLRPEHAQILHHAFDLTSTSMPKKWVGESRKMLADMERLGVPAEMRDAIDEIIADSQEIREEKPVSLSFFDALKLMRAGSVKMAVRMAEDDMRSQKGGKAKANEKVNESKEEAKQEEPKTDQKSSDKDAPFKWADVFRLDVSSVVGIALALWLSDYLLPLEAMKEITWQEFQTAFLDKGFVEKLVVTNEARVKVFLHREALAQAHPDSPAVKDRFFYYFTIGSVEAFERHMDAAQDELDIPTSERIPVSYTKSVSWLGTIISMSPTLLLIGLLVWSARRAGGGGGGGGASGIFGMGRSRAKKFNHETDIRIRFKDVAGMDEAKQEIMEFVSFLKEPGQYQALGAKIPRGAILSGPPGTGKTLLAKATAGESQVPFYSVSGSEFVEMFVGVGPSRVRDLFANARKNTPCIIFIDEIDAIGKSRAKNNFGGGNDERESTLNQILTEMDGFNTSEQVVVLAGTNRPDVLDSALLRPGRFDRHIAIDRPTTEGRKQIFQVHLQKIKVGEKDVDFLTGRLAALTPGFSGADIANCCNEAALIAARGKATQVNMAHFEAAIERTIGGLEKKSLVLSPEEKKTVAYHEAGHAICGWFFKWADPLLKVSIIPRGQGALGYAQYLPPGDTYLMNVHQLMDRMAMTLGGRVSEELHFETVTSGASDDFNKVTRMATAMVTKFGMSEKIGYVYFDEDDNRLHKPFSEDTARNIDSEVRRLVDKAYQQCRALLTAKKREVGIVAEELLKKEMLSRDDMVRLLGKRPFEDRKEFEKYFGGGERSAPPPPPTERNEPGTATL